MNTLIGMSPLGLAMIKHENKIFARKGIGMGAKNINRELKSTVAKQEAMIAQQQREFHATAAQQAKEIKALTAIVKDHKSQILKVMSAQLERSKRASRAVGNNEKGPHDLQIISRAACLAELTSNPKSFSNCPDLHGGVPGLPGGKICMKPALEVIAEDVMEEIQRRDSVGLPSALA